MDELFHLVQDPTAYPRFFSSAKVRSYLMIAYTCSSIYRGTSCHLPSLFLYIIHILLGVIFPPLSCRHSHLLIKECLYQVWTSWIILQCHHQSWHQCWCPIPRQDKACWSCQWLSRCSASPQSPVCSAVSIRSHAMGCPLEVWIPHAGTLCPFNVNREITNIGLASV